MRHPWSVLVRCIPADALRFVALVWQRAKAHRTHLTLRILQNRLEHHGLLGRGRDGSRR
jgi:hypothetical protein